ncbi:cyclin-dependent kinase 12-like [Clupea harengus]|uniref:Cyclin-dependent kinase 12-like n=1 Tax=Clupea harengus TaxID=7950 RepID=A0A8M1KC04_CLUHA|nr:cyclin-dependent kinase 12-like [Clupea harengus]
MDAADSCTDTAPLMDGTRLCSKVSKEETGGHTKASSVVSERVLALKSEPAFVKVMKKEEDVKEEPVAIRRKPVPCSTPITNPHRSYKPLAVDLSPLPPLPFTAYQPQPPTQVPWDFSPKAPTPSAHSNSQEAVRQRAPLHTEVGIPMTQADSQGRHSLPVQTVTWSVPSKRSVRQPMLRDRSLSAELEPR